MKRTRILVLCTANSARSQMAEGLFRHYGSDNYEVHSAGSKPDRLRPEAVEVMRELGIDISKQWSKSTQEFENQPFDYVITVCDSARDSCPAFPGPAQRIHWSIEDPAASGGSPEQRLAAFRSARDALRERIEAFLRERRAEQASPAADAIC